MASLSYLLILYVLIKYIYCEDFTNILHFPHLPITQGEEAYCRLGCTGLAAPVSISDAVQLHIVIFLR